MLPSEPRSTDFARRRDILPVEYGGAGECLGVPESTSKLATFRALCRSQGHPPLSGTDSDGSGRRPTRGNDHR
jgi:hypothetical protein